jgi:urease accessory protein
LQTRIELAEGARFVGWELTCLGRPASVQRFERGGLRQGIELWRGQRLVCVDRTTIEAGEAMLGEAWGLAGAPLYGTLIASPPPSDAGLAAAQLAAEEASSTTPLDQGGARASVTSIRDALVCRYLGVSGERCRALFARVWAALRPSLMGRPGVPPRIWST